MQRVKLGLVCLSWFCLVGAVSAQSPTDTVASPAGTALPQATSGSAVVTGGGIFDGTYLDVRHVIGDGVGYVNSYSQIGAFAPVWLTEDSLIAPNARLIVTNSTQTGVNVGLVGRQYVNDWDRILGVYGYYDNDQDQYNNRYSQFTIGAETLGQWWDLRANGYILNGTQNNFLSATSAGGNPFYSGNNIVFQGQQLRDQALGGVDAEFGVPLSPYTPWLRGYSGIYGYHSSQGSNTVGYRGRLEANIANDLMLGMTVSTDALYGTNINGIIEFKFSGFKPTVYFPNLTTRQRMLSSVQRNWRIATHTYMQDINIAAYNPNSSSSQPYFITFVNNAAGPGGNGTFEHPYNTLPSTAPGNIILVENGTSSQTNPVMGAITLANNQVLIGSGFPYPISLAAQYGSSNINGTYTLPGTSSSNPYPVLGGNGTSSSIVTLANNNEVAGLTLMNSTGGGITNTSAGSSNFYLHDLNILGNNGYGISLTNASSNANSNNQISQLNGSLVSGAIISNINVGNGGLTNSQGRGGNTLGGIQISTGSPGLNLQISNVDMNLNGTSASPNAFGISLTANNAPLDVTMNNVETSGNTGDGIQVQGTGQGIALTGSSVTASNNGGSGLVFNLSGGSGTFNLPGSALSGSPDTVTGNLGNGLAIFGSNGATIATSVDNGLFTGNGIDAFHVEGTSGANITLNVDPTNASGSGRDGLYYKLDGVDTVLRTTFSNDSLDNSGTSAVYGLLTNYAGVNLQFNGTHGINSGADGFYLNAASGSQATLTLTGGSFANSGTTTPGSSAFSISATDNSTNVTLTTNSTFGNNNAANGSVGTQDYGLNLSVANNAAFTGTFNDGSFSNALTNAFLFNVTSGGYANVTLAGTSGNNSGADGINGTVSGSGATASAALLTIGSSAAGNISTFNDSADNGMNVTVASAGQLTVNATNSSFSGSGTDGVSGSGVLGVVTGSGSSAALNFTNTTINTNLDNGVFLTANTQGVVQASFSGGSINQNGVTTLTGNYNDGIRLDLNRSGTSGTQSMLTLTNGTTINGNGNDGVEIAANSSTYFTGAFTRTVIENNGVASNPGTLLYTPNMAGIEVTAQNSSNVNLNFTTVTSSNTGSSTSQQMGFLSNTDSGSQLTASFTGSTLSSNTSDAISTSVDGAGSVATVSIANTTGDHSGNIGAFFNVTGGATLNVSSSSGSAFSNSAGTGFYVNVDGTTGNSVANLHLDSIVLLDNGLSGFGGQGLYAAANNGGVLNAEILSSTMTTSATSSSNQGIQIVADGSNGSGQSTVNFDVRDTTVDTNGGEGLLINATNGAVINYRSLDSSYSGNGVYGTFDGVNVSADGAGTIVRLLFTGDTFDNNSGNGLSLSATNGATLTTSLNGITDTGNAGYGISSTATGLGTTFNLLMTGTNTISGNTAGSFSAFNFSNINQAILELTGSFNGSTTASNGTGDGLDIELANLTNAIVSVQGGGTDTIDNNAGYGLYVTLSNITGSGSLLVNGYADISMNGVSTGKDGIYANFTNVANGAVQISGATTTTNTTMTSNGNDAINLNFTDTNLVNNFTLTGVSTVSVLTTTANLPTLTSPNLPLATLPMPVNQTITGISPTTNALSVSGITATDNVANGISITATSTNIDANGAFVTDNQVTGSTTGDGIVVSLTSSSADGLSITDNVSQSNTLGNGLSIILSSTPINNLTISGNTLGAASATTTTSSLGNGLDGLRLGLNDSTLINLNINNNEINGNGTVTTSLGHGIEFTDIPGGSGAVANSDITDAYFYGNTITGNTGDGIHLVNPITSTSQISLSFGLTPAGVASADTISNNGGDGVNLSLVTGQQDLVANFTGETISSNTGAGVNIQLADNHNFLASNTDGTITGGFTGNTIDSNGAQGVNFIMGLNGNITTNFVNNTISSNTLQGINFTMGASSSFTTGILTSNFTGNTISSNLAEGININLATGDSFFGNSFYGNTISDNGSLGVRLTAPDQTAFLWNLGSSTEKINIFDGNSAAGVGINMTGSATGTLNVQNTTFSDTKVGTDANPYFIGAGLAIVLNNTASIDGSTIGSYNAVNSVATNNVTFSDNAGAGLSIVGQGDSSVANVMITNVNATGNTGDGIDITRFGGSTFNNITVQNSQITKNLIGLSITATNALLLDTYQISNNVINQNNSDGVRFDVKFDAQIDAEMANNTINANLGDGIHVIETANATTDNRLVTGTWTMNTITNNSLNGIEIAAANTINIGASTTETDNTITGNGENGILISGVGTTPTGVSDTVIQGNFINQNTGDGIAVTAADTAVTINTNEIWYNTGSGIQISDEGGGTVLNASIDNSSIRFNTGDGIKLDSSGTASNSTTGDDGVFNHFNVTIGATAGNDVSDNQGHGINILNQADGQAFITIGGSNATTNVNNINRNGLEGVYVVNTASSDQTQNSTIDVLADGNVFDQSQMKFILENAVIMNNGYNAIGANYSDTTGLYLRVGSNGASTNEQSAGGFASTASSTNSISTATLAGNGGVLALINNNTFGGNGGHDLSFGSFVSTVNPIITGGTVTETSTPSTATPPGPPTITYTYTAPTFYQSSPLSRLDLQFTGNVAQDGYVSRLLTTTPDAQDGNSYNYYPYAGTIFTSLPTTPANAVNAQPLQLLNPYGIGSIVRQAAPITEGGFTLPIYYPGQGADTFRTTTTSANNTSNTFTTFFDGFNTNQNDNLTPWYTSLMD